MSERAASSLWPRVRPWLLLVATLVTTFYAGLWMSETYSVSVGWATRFGGAFADVLPRWWTLRRVWFDALSFSLSLVGILGAHEMGHYLTARRRGVDVSAPHFIPFLPPFGTLGAVMRLRTHKMPGKSLLRIAVGGPYAGMVVAIPVLIAGLLLSDVRPTSAPGNLRAPILMKALEIAIHHPIPEGHELYLHPMAFAGWAGCFVTSFNLLPIGQLDGGHTAYCLIGPRYNTWAPRLLVGLAVMGVLVYPPWLILCLLLWRVMGAKHPLMCTDLPVTGLERRLGWGAALLFLLTFTPQPFVEYGEWSLVGLLLQLAAT